MSGSILNLFSEAAGDARRNGSRSGEDQLRRRLVLKYGIPESMASEACICGPVDLLDAVRGKIPLSAYRDLTAGRLAVIRVKGRKHGWIASMHSSASSGAVVVAESPDGEPVYIWYLEDTDKEAVCQMRAL